MTREPEDERGEDEVDEVDASGDAEGVGGDEVADADGRAEAAGAGGDEGVAGAGPEAGDVEGAARNGGADEGPEAGGVMGLVRARGPQKAVLMLAGLVVGLMLVVGWFVVAGGDDDSDETEVSADDEREEAPAPEATEPSEPTTTASETTTTTLSAEEEAELEVIEAYEAALEAIDEASAAPAPDPDHPALEETHTGAQLEVIAVDVEVLALSGTATRYPEDSQRDIDVRSVVFGEEDGVETAELEVCEVTDEEEFFVDTGDVYAGREGARTRERTVAMHHVDGNWKVALLEQHGTEDGVAGCALD